MEWRRDGFVISTDAGRLDLAFTVDYLAQTYWGKDTPKEKIRRSIDNALVFGLYQDDGRQVGFCRVVSDKARFAWLSDVFVLDEMRGRNLGKWLVECAVSHRDLADVNRFFLATADAHGLYRQFGFEALADVEKFMMKS
ncbi:MAG: GNAT family N-acetyltransferase [Rhodospirillaceae bacterium]|jgi:N-acetylglutamate synthase-like GNAT family acetyltransferase|nr:GNAT family N-acetyltransferase [Rhodospirillaceae bacterium]MBT4490304.1 GNAT family N-acetyltransferase [Rhodospirillaceae bacterium]MBT5191942.1 GNAT family N-acetyltransferase [Rhodospirillaceae bacterium]MBT5895202.1 GNAT family N-acetyltransferase [Rhodospirillaceae bacterium]MBT6430301.1 GNAT family N-acetyltransferase [Rhodospirillaceae bacterium]